MKTNIFPFVTLFSFLFSSRSGFFNINKAVSGLCLRVCELANTHRGTGTEQRYNALNSLYYLIFALNFRKDSSTKEPCLVCACVCVSLRTHTGAQAGQGDTFTLPKNNSLRTVERSEAVSALVLALSRKINMQGQ